MASENTRDGLDYIKVILVFLLVACIGLGALVVVDVFKLKEIKAQYMRAENMVPQIRDLADGLLKLREKESASKAELAFHLYIESQICTGALVEREAFKLESGGKPKHDKKFGFVDESMRVSFPQAKGKQKLTLSREKIFNILYNLESQSPQISISRFRIDAVETISKRSRKEDPKILSDMWVVKELTVVQRRPSQAEFKKPRKKR